MSPHLNDSERRVGTVVTIGETMLRFSASRIGSLAHSATADIGMGGAESNVAIGLARLGVPTTWTSRLGADAGGDFIVRELQSEGVTVQASRVSTAPTGLMIKERRTPGTTNVVYYRAGSAASGMSPGDLDPAVIAGARLLHLTGITPALSPSCRELTLAAIAMARAAGVPVSFDLNFRSRLWSAADAASFYREILPSVDIVFAGEDEAKIVTETGDDAEVLARQLAEFGSPTIVLKRGAAGAIALTADDVVSCDAVSISPVDTVGAGDGFVAGYLAEHLSGGTPEQCLAVAVVAGAFACLSDGDWEGAPRRSELALLTALDPVSR
ncbi:sugar kinase [Salinibacterium sp. G-O1]|uniref:sugar kinase n=1 Tax=Salinibacterium sp. G-O1 TaxID=3046208 RepID=UPI0024BB5594|nr:sugar kinase [Salinibacterium sp. G-O1]MDJ0335333.1 sugar kinase [Salinibacterium sp. G-O1]